jgi:hypothetical protein
MRRPEEFSDVVDQYDSAVLQQKVIKYFSSRPTGVDVEGLQNLAKELEISDEGLVLIMSSLLTSFFAYGKAVENKNAAVDPKQLEAGIKVEMEHTDNPLISEKIARDHITSIPIYYSLLIEMESSYEQH